MPSTRDITLKHPKSDGTIKVTLRRLGKGYATLRLGGVLMDVRLKDGLVFGANDTKYLDWQVVDEDLKSLKQEAARIHDDPNLP